MPCQSLGAASGSAENGETRCSAGSEVCAKLLLRTRGGFQCFIGNRVGEDFFVSLVEGDSVGIHDNGLSKSAPLGSVMEVFKRGHLAISKGTGGDGKGPVPGGGGAGGGDPPAIGPVIRGLLARQPKPRAEMKAEMENEG